MFRRLVVISLETPQRIWASSRLEGRTSWIFPSCGRCSQVTLETSGTRSGGLGKASPHASCSGPEVRCDEPRDASADMGLISPGGENLLDFLELRQVL